MSLRPRALRVLATVLVAVIVGAMAVVLGASSAQAAVYDTFTKVYSHNAHGSILLAGNTLETCVASTNCTAAQNHVQTATDTRTALIHNNDFTSRYVDVDSDPTTFNSSSARLSVPTDGSVLFAGLVWSARVPTATAPTNADPAKRQNVVFTTPDGVPHALVGTVAQSATASTSRPYQGYLDVTSLVAAAGSGAYTVANVQANVGAVDTYAGWSLAVAVADPNAPMRNLTVFKGFGELNQANAADRSQAFRVSGFLTPPQGQVQTTIGVVGYEGDDGYTGDSLSIQGDTSATASAISDGLNPANDVFNSTISTRGTDAAVGDPTLRTPNYRNQLGLDIDTFNADGILQNGETGATVTLTTSAANGETYYPGVVTLATDLYDPKLNGVKTASLSYDANGDGKANVGDRIHYEVAIQNDGLDSAADSTFFDAIPTGTSYVPNSLRIDSVAVSDAAGDDTGEYVASPTGHVVARIGTGASASAGGVIRTTSASTDHAVVGFDVTILSAAARGKQLTNAADIIYSGATTGQHAASVSNLVLNVVPEGTASTIAAPDRVVTFEPTVAAPSLTIPVLPGVTGATDPTRVVALTDAAGGTVTVNPDGTLRYTPSATFAGRDLFTYTVEDSTGARATGTIKVDVLDTPPTPVDDAAPISHSNPTTVDPLANDSDPNGDAFSIYSVTANGTTITGTQILTTSTGGTLQLFGGRVVYTPPTGGLATGATEVFTYVPQDARGFRATSPGTVTLTAGNSAPVAADDVARVRSGSSVTVDPTVDDTDADGDALSITTLGTPAHGAVTRTGNSVTYTPDASYTGTDSFGYTISDGHGGTATATVRVYGPPIANPDSYTATVGSYSVSGNLLGNDTDPDPAATLTLDAVAAPTGSQVGTVVYSPTGGVTFTAPNGYLGTQTRSYAISDSTMSDASTATFIIPNVDPTATATTATIPATTGGIIPVLGQVTDPNATAGYQTLTVTAASAPNTTATIQADGSVKVVPDAGFKGTTTLSYTAFDGVASVTSTVTVTVANNAPVANLETVHTATDTSVDVDALANDSDPDSDPLTISAVGSPVDAGSTVRGTATIAGGKVRFAPNTGWTGTVTIPYTISDGSTTASSTVTVVVDDAVPTPADDAFSVARSTSITVDPAANDTDLNGDAITVYSVSANGFTITEGQSLSLASGGTLAVTGGEVVYTPPPAGLNAGDTETFTYIPQDSRGGRGTASGTVTLTAANAGPVALDDSARVRPGNSVSLDPRGNDSDPDGDSLVVTAAGAAAHGTVALAGNTITYTPDGTFAGTDAFPYTISDGHGGTASATVHVYGPPVAVADTFSATVGQYSVAGTVLGNDSDPKPGATLSLDSVDPPAIGSVTFRSTGGVTFTAPTGYVGSQTVGYRVTDGVLTADSTVTFVIPNIVPTASAGTATVPATTGGRVPLLPRVTDPNAAAGYQTLTTVSAGAPNATVTINPDGSAQVVPDRGVHGTVTLSYTVSDGGASVSSTVTVTVANNAPTASTDTVSTPTDTPIDVDALANDTDPDGDPLTITVVGTAGDAGSTPRGTASLAGGTVRFVPDAGWTGTVTIPYTISDGFDTASSTVVVTVDNAPPTPVNDTIPVSRTASTTVDPGANDTDPNGDAVSVYSVTANGVTVLDGGTVVLADGGTLKLTAGKVVFTPPVGGLATGATEPFTYVAQDSRGERSTASGTVTLHAQNLAPTAGDDTLRVQRDAAATPVSVLANDTDPDGDVLTVTAVGTAAHGTATTDGTVVRYRPTTGYVGTDSVVYTIADGNGGTATATLRIVVDGPPVAVADLFTAAGGASSVSGNVLTNDTDPNGDTLSVSAVTPPTRGAISFSSGGMVTFAPPPGFVGDQSVTYTVSDGASTATGTVTFRVGNIAPTASPTTATATSSTPVTIAVQSQVTDPNVANGYQSLTTTAATVDANGTATVKADGSVVVTPTTGYTGDIVLTYTVSDGLATVTSTVAITFADGGPTAQPDSVHTPTSTPIDVLVLTNDADADGDPITITGVGTPATGSASIAGSAIRYQPPTGWAGTVSFPYTITAGAKTATASVTVIVDNADPVANADTDTAPDYRTTTTTDVLGNDADPNIPATSQAMSIVSAVADHGAAVTIIGSSLRVTPATGYRGPIAVDYAISDGAGGTATGRLTVTVGDAPPVIVDPVVTSTGNGVTVDLIGTSSDPNGDPLTVSSVGPALGTDGQPHGTVTRTGNVITIAPDAGYTGVLGVAYTISDGQGGQSAGTVRLTVGAASSGGGSTGTGSTGTGSTGSGSASSAARGSGRASGSATSASRLATTGVLGVPGLLLAVFLGLAGVTLMLVARRRRGVSTTR